jgi:hypothetical protein
MRERESSRCPHPLSQEAAVALISSARIDGARAARQLPACLRKKTGEARWARLLLG